MGQERIVTFEGSPPTWESVRELLAERGFPVQVRMIDGELSFPDETPPATWQELRVGTTSGMISLRREPQRIRVITWGNADLEMLRAWNALAWACAEAGAGRVEAEQSSLSAMEFAARENLPPAWGRDGR